MDATERKDAWWAYEETNQAFCFPFLKTDLDLSKIFVLKKGDNYHHKKKW